MAILSAASATLAEGEVMQMTTQNDLSTSVDQYLQVIYGKTAALLRLRANLALSLVKLHQNSVKHCACMAPIWAWLSSL